MEGGDRIVDKDEALHDDLAPLRRQVRILCPVVEVFVLAMLDIQARIRPSRTVRSELVGDHHAWRANELLRCELLRCAPTLAALNQGAQNQAVRIDGANMALLLVVD